jgi:AraC-like DNA-binding protein
VDNSVRAGALQGFDDVVAELGGDPEQLLRRNGLDPLSLWDPEAMISLDAVANLMEDAARQFDAPTFGLRHGSAQDISMLGLLAIVLQNAPTIGQAVVSVSKFLFAHSPSYELALQNPGSHIPGCADIRFDVSVETAVSQRQLIDGCLASTYRLAQLLSPVPIRLAGVSIPHTPTASHGQYRAHFDAPVYFEQPYAALHVDPSILDVSLGGMKSTLHDHAVAYIAARYPAADNDVSVRVRSTLKGTIGANQGTKAQIAALLGLHPRTLQRRLTAEGTTFDDIKNEVYRAATWRLLHDTAIPLGQAAAALGFSEQSAMNRSVRRWFGITPTELRRTRM